MINEAEGYANEQVALARGQGEALVQEAKGYLVSRSERAGGDAERFRQLESAYRAAPASTSTRLYLEAMEEILPGRKKLIIDSQGGRRTLWTVDDGVLVAPPGAQMQQPPPPFEMPEPGE
jgi:membrane protease subunit HflK